MQPKPCYCIEDDCPNPVHLPAPRGPLVQLPELPDGAVMLHTPQHPLFENFCTTLEPWFTRQTPR